MLLLGIPRPEPLQLWNHAPVPASDKPVSDFVYVLVLFIACCGGCLHGIAMAIRKKYGEGHEKYWLEWKWWVGTVVDGFAGFLIWPAMPFVSVQILVPLIIVIQLGTSYICGLLMFGEKCVALHNLGIVCAIVGIVGISLATTPHASEFSIDEFWSKWVSVRFITTNLVVAVLLIGSHFTLHKSTFYALLAAAFEGIQYICSRSIVDSIFDVAHLVFIEPRVLAAVCIKICCILGILHFQQLGLEADLSRFAGIYLVGCTLFMCVYGSAFFGDEMPVSPMFYVSAASTLVGIWLLNQSGGVAGTTPRLSEREPKLSMAKEEVAGNPQDT